MRVGAGGATIPQEGMLQLVSEIAGTVASANKSIETRRNGSPVVLGVTCAA